MDRESVIGKFIDSAADLYLPDDVRHELYQCAASNGRISVEYLVAIYRCGRAAGRAAETDHADREAAARQEAERIAKALVGFQSLYQRNVCDSAPGNAHYAGMLLAIVDDARAYFGFPVRPSVAETMAERHSDRD